VIQCDRHGEKPSVLIAVEPNHGLRKAMSFAALARLERLDSFISEDFNGIADAPIERQVRQFHTLHFGRTPAVLYTYALMHDRICKLDQHPLSLKP
jgi:hypothetical protein